MPGVRRRIGGTISSIVKHCRSSILTQPVRSAPLALPPFPGTALLLIGNLIGFWIICVYRKSGKYSFESDDFRKY